VLEVWSAPGVMSCCTQHEHSSATEQLTVRACCGEGQSALDGSSGSQERQAAMHDDDAARAAAVGPAYLKGAGVGDTSFGGSSSLETTCAWHTAG
jgi:hypothetical protein